MEINHNTSSLLSSLLILIILTFAPSMGSADQNNFEYGETSDRLSYASERLRGVDFNWEARMHVSTLVGEPIVHARFRWQVMPLQSRVEIPSFRGAEDPYTTIDLPSLGSEAAQKIALIQAKVAFLFMENSGFEGYGILADVGVVESPDGETWSFNIPSSPDWSKLIFRFNILPTGADVSELNFLSEEEAKNLYIEGLEFSRAVLWDAEVSFYQLQNWYAQYTSAPEILATQRAYRRAATRVYNSFGLFAEKSFIGASQTDWIARAGSIDHSFFVANFDRELATPQITAEPIYLEDLTQSYRRLASLPREFTRNGDAVAYRREMALVREEMVRDIERAREWTTSEKNPDDYPRGVETEESNSEVERIFLFETLQFGGSSKQQDMEDYLNVWKFLYPDVGFSIRLIDRRRFEYSACSGEYCGEFFITARVVARCEGPCPEDLFADRARLPEEGSDKFEELEVLFRRSPNRTSINVSFYNGRDDFNMTHTIEELNAILNRMDIRDYRIEPIEGEFALP